MKIADIPPPPAQPPAPSAVDKLEMAFLTEMMKHIVPPPDGPFSGGAGEQQFGSWLTEARAQALVARIDLGFGTAFGGAHG